MIFESNNQAIGWDGTFKLKDQPIGVYVYTLEAQTINGIEYNLNGEVSIIR